MNTVHVPLGPAGKGFHSYRQFAESVQSDLRFIRSRVADDFLHELLTIYATRRKFTVSEGTTFWRARLGSERRQSVDDSGDPHVVRIEEEPYAPEGMKPISNWQSEGRANPRGIPCLYMATTRETALAEVRPWLGATISVAKLRVNRELTLIDCSRRYAKEDLEIIRDAKSSTDDGIWVAIDRAFATPVSKDNEAREYIPTQIIAELFKSSDKNYHGIKYKSMLVEDGFNVALFNLNHADVLDVALSKADSLKFQFSP
jgi:hypothetical protein